MMVDLTQNLSSSHIEGNGGSGGGGGIKLKNFVGKTPGVLKTKFLKVLGSSNELITDISNKIDVVLTLSSSSESTGSRETGYDEENSNISKTTYDSTHGDPFDFELRRIKERRAHEEVLSGKYRQPNYSIANNDAISLLDMSEDMYSINASSNSDAISDSSPSEPNISVSNSHKTDSKELSSNYLKPPKFLPPSTSSGGSGIENESAADDAETNKNLQSLDRSESFNSVQSTISSLSIDSHNIGDDDGSCGGDYTFMKQFVKILFENSNAITPEYKSEFGRLAMTETGRMWFSRLINNQRVKTKRVNELTFYALVQYFAVVLFECSEADDFTPAKNLMNMCFTFFHEVDVPGCEPYREYLYNYLREQPIWLSLRFWNAAFFDALQMERANRPIPKINSGITLSIDDIGDVDDDPYSVDVKSSLSSSSSDLNSEIREDQTFQQNITFGQLGTFTCNMHAFGLGKDLCIEFLRKQCTIASISEEQEKMLRDNINRMYKETDKWRE